MSARHVLFVQVEDAAEDIRVNIRIFCLDSLQRFAYAFAPGIFVIRTRITKVFKSISPGDFNDTLLIQKIDGAHK